MYRDERIEENEHTKKRRGYRRSPRFDHESDITARGVSLHLEEGKYIYMNAYIRVRRRRSACLCTDYFLAFQLSLNDLDGAHTHTHRERETCSNEDEEEKNRTRVLFISII